MATSYPSSDRAPWEIKLSEEKELPDGSKVTKSGLHYNPDTKTFRPATEAEKNWDPKKHPRAEAGAAGGTGGQFVPVGQARSAEAAKAQQDPKAKGNYERIAKLDDGKRRAEIGKLADADLQALTRTTYSFKSSDASVVALRTALAAELAKRGMDVRKYGALGTDKTPAKPKPKAAPKAKPGKAPAEHKGAKVTARFEDGSARYADGMVWDAEDGGFRKPIKTSSQAPAVELSAKTAAYSVTPNPTGKPGGPGLWGRKGWHLPPYIQNVAKGIMRSGKTRSQAIEIAIGRIKDWARGGGDVSPEVRAASIKAVAQWEALKARARVKLSAETGAIELASVKVGGSYQHVPGTQYNWRHGFRPLNVQTALMWRKKSWANKLHASGAAHAAPESKSYYRKNPGKAKTLWAPIKLEAVDKKTPGAGKAELPKGASAAAKKAHASPDIAPNQLNAKSVQAHALQKAVKTGKTQWVTKNDKGDLAVSEKKPAVSSKVVEFTPAGKAFGHTPAGGKSPVPQKMINEELVPHFAGGADKKTKPAPIDKAQQKAAGTYGSLDTAPKPPSGDKPAPKMAQAPIGPKGPAKLKPGQEKQASTLGSTHGPVPPPKAAEPVVETPGRFTPIDTSNWTKKGGQKGSNPGGTYVDEKGVSHYVKSSKSPSHAKNEALAAGLYHLAGVNSADVRLVNHHDKVGTASPLIPGATPDFAAKLSDAAYKRKAQEGFAVDAWLGNWDVVGLNKDNMVTDASGNPVRIDPGGALLYRAQGAPKGAAFGNSVDEWDSLRNGGKNPQAASVFSGMTDAELKASAQKVVDISPAQIDAMVDKAGFPTVTANKLKATLKARREDIAAKAGLDLPEKSGTKADAAQAAKVEAQVRVLQKHGLAEKDDEIELDEPAPKSDASETAPSPTAAAKIAKKKAAETGQTHYTVNLGPKKYGVSTEKPDAKHISVSPDGTLKIHNPGAPAMTVGRKAELPTAVAAPAVIDGKRTKKGALVVQVPVGDHKAGDKIQVKSPKGNVHSVEVTGVGKEFNKGGVPHQYAYVKKVQGDAPAPEAPSGDKSIGAPSLVNHLGQKPPADQVQKLVDQAQTHGKAVYMTPSTGMPSGFLMSDGQPAEGIAHYVANKDGGVSSVDSDGLWTEIKPTKLGSGSAPAPAPAPKAATPKGPATSTHDSLVEAKAAAGALADSLGKPTYMVPGTNGDPHKVTLTKPSTADGYAAGTQYKLYEPGEVSLGYKQVAEGGGAATPAAGMEKHVANAKAANPLTLTGSNGVAVAFQKAVKEGKPHWADEKGQPSTTKPTTGAGVKINPDGSMEWVGGQAEGTPVSPVLAKSMLGNFGGGMDPEHKAPAAPSGKPLTPKQQTAVNELVDAGLSGHVYADGTISGTKPAEHKMGESHVKVGTDGSITHVAAGAATPAAPKPKLKNPPTKAAKGLGPTNKALYNAEDIPVDDNTGPTTSHAAAMQKAIKTGKRQYLAGAASSAKGPSVETKPEGQKITIFEPDGTIKTSYTGGTYFYETKPTTAKKYAQVGLGSVGSSIQSSSSSKSSTASVNPRTPQVQGAAPGELPSHAHGTGEGIGTVHPSIQKWFEGTPEAAYIERHKPGLPGESKIATHAKETTQWESAEKSAVMKYQGSYAWTLNDKLRTGKPLAPSDKAAIKNIDAAIAKYAVPETVVVNRGLNAAHFPTENLVGKMVQDSGYMSTSFQSGFQKQVMMHLVVPKGTHGAPVRAAGSDIGEGELLLPRGTQILVSKDETDANGIRHLTATVVPTPQGTKSTTGIVNKQTVTVGSAGGAYGVEGLKYLQVHGRAAWLRKYGLGADGKAQPGSAGGLPSAAPALSGAGG